MKNKFLKIAVACSVIAVLAACSSTRLLTSWVGELPKNTGGKLLVFSLLGNKGERFQDAFEDAVVARLKSKKVDVYSAYDVYGPDALKKMDKEKLANDIREKGFDGVMLITLLDKEQDEEYVPPTTTTYAVPTGPAFYDPWFGPYFHCYNYYYDQVTTPGYWKETDHYIMEARVFNAKDANDAVYIAKTDTTDPTDAVSMANEFASTIVKDMSKKGLFKKR